ncbi:MAG: hypothetical protein ACKOTB_17275, partial [Planctomycetia bacterium]
ACRDAGADRPGSSMTTAAAGACAPFTPERLPSHAAHRLGVVRRPNSRHNTAPRQRRPPRPLPGEEALS